MTAALRTADGRKLYSAAILSLIGIIVLSTLAVPIMAAPNAYEDIIYDSRFEGDMGSIGVIVAFLDNWLVRIISFVGFFIITAAMLRNVLTGAYVTYPRMFDMISAYKEDAVGKYDKHTGKREGGKYQGVLGWVLAILIPDVKKLTDFADDGFGVANPRQYFLKALFQGIVAVIIGVMIYNGLYRDLIAKGAGLGTHLVQNYLLKFDLVGYFDRTVQTGKMYKFVWDSGSTDGDKQRNEVAKKVYTEVVNQFDDITTTETRAQVGQLVENYLIGVFSGKDTAAGGAIPMQTEDNSENRIDAQIPDGTPDSYFGNPNYIFGFNVENTLGTVQPQPPAESPEGNVVFFYAFTAESMGITGYNPAANSQNYLRAVLTFRRTNRSANDAAAAAAASDSVTAQVTVTNATGSLKDGLTVTIGGLGGETAASFAGDGVYTLGTDMRVDVKAVSATTLNLKLTNGSGGENSAAAINSVDKLTGTLVHPDTGAEPMITYDGKNVKEIAFSSGGSTVITDGYGQEVAYGTKLKAPPEEAGGAAAEGDGEGEGEEEASDSSNAG